MRMIKNNSDEREGECGGEGGPLLEQEVRGVGGSYFHVFWE